MVASDRRAAQDARDPAGGGTRDAGDGRGAGLLTTPVGRKALFGLLYFAEGAPIGFVWWALPVLLRRRGLEPVAIGALTGTLVLPWALKFLWAPLVDVLRGPRFGLRGWILASQVAMVASLAPLVWIETVDVAALLPWLLVHACAAATQDVAIDALAIGASDPAERGALNGWMQAGMLAGRGVFGGAVLAWREELGLSGIAGLLVAVLAATLLVHGFYRAPDGRPPKDAPGDGAGRAPRWRAFGATLSRALGQKRTWLALAFAATSGAAFEVVGAMAGPLLVDRGFGDAAISRFFALPAVLGLGIGALAGGWLSDRFGRRRVVAVSGVCVAVAAAALAGLVESAASPWPTLSALYFAAGCFTASTYALFMDLTDPRLGSTQFSAYMGATNLCESWSARAAGRVVAGPGYPTAFLGGAAIGLASLALLVFLRSGARGGPPEGRDR